jgi:hypothetical protein
MLHDGFSLNNILLFVLGKKKQLQEIQVEKNNA